MSRKRNTGQFDYWKLLRLLASVGLMLFLVFSISNKLNSNIEKLNISIDQSSSKKKLITSKEVRAILKYELGYDVSIAEVRQLDLFKLEKTLLENDRIEATKLYLDKHNVLHVTITQKKPIVRVDVTNGPDYYLDYNGDRVPVTEVFRVPVVTGHVDEYSMTYKRQKKHNLNAVLEVARKVNDDSFLLALVEQIHIDKQDEITLVPKVGRDKILLGQADDLDEKIYKLKTYYERGLKNIGLDKFDELDLKYKGQIIGRQKDT